MNLKSEKEFYRILEEAFDKSPREREAFLRAACGDDQAQMDKFRRYLTNADRLSEDDSFDQQVVNAIQEKVRQALNVDDGAECDDALIGQTLNHYRFIEIIGKGGMGVVYKAEDLRLNRAVAIKVVPRESAYIDEYRKRFEREAKAIAALNHPNIVTVYSIEEAEGLNFITMELVEGKTLADLIPSRGFPLKKLLALAAPMADALNAAHMRGLVHRDLKPANIMVNQDGLVKILDFGLARWQSPPQGADPDTRLTKKGRVLGTYPYMSPEQVKCQKVDHLSDIFSLGVIFYEMATGDRPFKGESSGELISSILRDSPRSVSTINSGLPNHLSRIIIRCLEKNPRQRCQSALDLRDELENLLKDLESGEFVTYSSLFASSGKWRRLPRTCQFRIFAILTVLLFVGGGALMLFHYSSNGTVEVKPFKDMKWIYIAPFINQTNSPILDRFDVLVREGLSQSRDVILYPEFGMMTGVDVERPPPNLDLSLNRHRRRLRDLEIVQVIDGTLKRSETGNYIIEVRLTRLPFDQDPIEVRDSFPEIEKIQAVADKLNTQILGCLGKTNIDQHILGRMVEDPNVFVNYFKALNAYASGGIDKAILLLKDIVKREPGFATAHSRLSVYISALGQSGSSTHASLAYENREGLSDRDHRWVGGVYAMNRYDYEGAKADYQYVEGLYTPDQYTFRQVTHCHSALGETGLAVEAAYKARALSPNNVINNGMVIISLVEDNQFQRAWEEYELAVDRFPNQFYPHWGGGLALLGLGEPERARAIFKLLRSSPDSFMKSYADLLVAKTYAYQGRFDQAVRALEDELAFDRNNHLMDSFATRKLWLAQLETLRGDKAAALRHLSYFDDLKPETINLRKFREVGLTYLELGEIEKARRCSRLLESVAQVEGHQFGKAFANHLRGALLDAVGEPGAEQALNHAKESLKNPLILWSWAQFLQKEGAFEEAIHIYQKILNEGKGHLLRDKLSFRWGRAHWRLAQCQLALGNIDAAHAYRDKFLALWGVYAPNHPEVLKAREMK